MKVDKNKCLYCGGCVGVCPYDAIELRETAIVFNLEKCVRCSLCMQFCPVGAITVDKK